MSLVTKICKLCVFLGFTILAVLLVKHWLATKQYVFTKEDVAKIATQYAGKFVTNSNKLYLNILKHMAISAL